MIDEVRKESLMKTVWKWVIGIVVGLLVLALLIGIPFLFHVIRPETYGSLRGFFPGHMRGYGMMPYGHFGMMSFGGIFGWLVQLGVLALIVLGVVWLVGAIRSNKTPVKTCPKCGKAVQLDWKNCPYCGNKL
jgi:hypothetical protein